MSDVPRNPDVTPGNPDRERRAHESLSELTWHDLIDRLLTDRAAPVAMQDAEGTRGERLSTDSAAWTELATRVRHLAALATRWQWSLSHDEMEDVAQDTVIQFTNVENLQRLRAARSPTAYVVVSLKNRAHNVDRGRRRAERSRVSWSREMDAGGMGASPTADYQLDDGVVQSAPDVLELRRVLETLPPADQALVHQRFWLGHTIAGMAAARGMKYSAMATRIFRILRTLRARLGK